MNFDRFLSLSYKNTEFLLNYLLNKLILFIPICNSCGSEAQTMEYDDVLYRCNKMVNGRRCNFKKSLLKNSFFRNSQIGLRHIFLIMDNWRKGVVCDIVAKDFEMDASTVSRWYRKLDDLVVSSFAIRYNNMIGGENIVVEVDECLSVKRKYERGRIFQNQVWILGGVERGNPANYFIEVVQTRSRPRLIDVIRRRVRSGSIIMTDLWRGYTNLTIYLYEKNFLHFTVNHSVNFVDPDTGAYTQSIEGFWSVYKRIVRKRGTNIGDAQRRVNIYHVYRFLKDNRDNIFDSILHIITEYTIFEISN